MKRQSTKIHLLLIQLLVCLCTIFWGGQAGFAEEADIHLVSPIAAVARSVVMPGWGQFYTQGYLQGSVSIVGTGGLLFGSLLAHRSFRDIYDNEYVPAAKKKRDSSEALSYYNLANQRFKLRQFFLMAAAGVWAYSIIDSYVGANLYNAKTKANSLIDDVKQIEELGVQFGVTPTQLHIGIVKNF
ncbi:MAG: DUF5683 domain-containing protein [Candidatus Poribacteria bacterium]|nr:DUF5683 domain-containing protein [Candidatus Poribacteria bacterium]